MILYPDEPKQSIRFKPINHLTPSNLISSSSSASRAMLVNPVISIVLNQSGFISMHALNGVIVLHFLETATK